MFSPTFPPEGLTKITEVFSSEKLLDAILQEGCDVNCLRDAIEMVNPSIDICLLMENAKQFMLEDWQNFQGCLKKKVVVYDGKEFVHLTDVAPDPVTKGKITRRFKNLKESYMHFYSSTICMKHQKGGCNLVPKHIAFLFYLGLFIDTQPQDPKTHSETEQETSKVDGPISFQSVSTIENLDKAEKLEEEPIDLAIEEKESAKFLDVALFRATTVVDEPTEDISISENSLTLVHLPFFHINGKDYITLHSIQSLFNMREDYCIAAIAEASQFLEALDAFGLCLNRVAEEEPALKDEDFETRLVELGVEKFERNIVEPDKISFDMGAKINLEHEGQIEADELQKIELLDFLGRAGGCTLEEEVGNILPYWTRSIARRFREVHGRDGQSSELQHSMDYRGMQRVIDEEDSDAIVEDLDGATDYLSVSLFWLVLYFGSDLVSFSVDSSSGFVLVLDWLAVLVLDWSLVGSSVFGFWITGYWLAVWFWLALSSSGYAVWLADLVGGLQALVDKAQRAEKRFGVSHVKASKKSSKDKRKSRSKRRKWSDDLDLNTDTDSEKLIRILIRKRIQKVRRI
ncbi:hypothetical protein L7F22_013125 [Adiantum nelumboides]|nr:hypothetical protein [Adiantum nelumboides]